MADWYNALERKEQNLVILCAVLVVLWSVYMFGWKPLVDRNETLERRTAANAETLVFMRAGVQEVKALRGSGSGGPRGSLSQLSEQAAKASGLRINRFQPSGNNEAQIWLERAEYNKVLTWLDTVENHYGITVKSAAINTANVSGLVTARIRIKKGS